MISEASTGDRTRFRDIVRGQASSATCASASSPRARCSAARDKNIVSIPLPGIELPQVQASATTRRAASARARGTATGSRARARGTPGTSPGSHVLEVEVSLEEMAEILGEELRAAAHRAQGQGRAGGGRRGRYTGIRRTGPESLRHIKRTLRAALQAARSSLGASMTPKNPVLIPTRADRHYRSWKQNGSPAREQRRRALHDGRVGQHGEASRRRSSGSRPSGSTPG